MTPESESLETFPVDDTALDAVLHGMAGAYEVDEDGNHTLVPFNGEGGDFSLHDVLMFYSGYDPSKVVPYVDEDGRSHKYITEYTGGTLFTVEDIVRALIAEVRRLRPQPSDDSSGPPEEQP